MSPERARVRGGRRKVLTCSKPAALAVRSDSADDAEMDVSYLTQDQLLLVRLCVTLIARGMDEGPLRSKILELCAKGAEAQTKARDILKNVPRERRLDGDGEMEPSSEELGELLEEWER